MFIVIRILKEILVFDYKRGSKYKYPKILDIDYFFRISPQFFSNSLVVL